MNSSSTGVRVLMAVTAAPWVVSGAAKQAYQLADVLRTKGVKLCYLAISDERGSRGFRIRKMCHNGCPMYTIPLFRRWWTEPYTLLLAAILAWHLRGEFDILHVHGGASVLVTLTAFARLLGKQTLLKNTFNEWDTAEAVRKTRNRWQFRAYSGNHLICISRKQVKYGLKAGIPKGKITLIPNGVDIALYAYPERRYENKEGPLRLISVGYTIPLKGFDVLAKAVHIMLKRGSNVHLRIGTSLHSRRSDQEQCLSELRQLVLSLGLTDSVEFVSGDDVPRLMRESDVFVFASQDEGFGTVQIEAMASGLPSVAARIQDVNTEIYRDGTDAFLVPQNDPEALAGQVIRLARDSSLREKMGRAALQRAREEFSMDRVTGLYLELYRSLKL